MGASAVFDPTANAFAHETTSPSQKRKSHGPSKGCDNCRHRKVKCDERHPVCSYCHKRGLSCNYRDYSLLIFRDETTSAASKVRHRVQAKQHEREDLALTFGLELATPLPLSVQQTAITRFFHDFVLDTPTTLRDSNPNGGYFALIPDLYRRCKPRSCFALALSAAANANFWRRHKSFQARSNSLNDCGKALQQLRQDLQRRSRFHPTADMLAASSLLAMYELVVSRDVSQRTSWTVHVNGAVALLENGDQDDTEMHKLVGVLQVIVFQMLVDCLIMGRHPSLPLERCTSAVAPSRPPTALLGFMYSTAQLCASWKDIFSTDSVASTQRVVEIHEFLEKCQVLDEEIENWMQSRPEAARAVVLLENTEQNVPAPLRALFASSGAPTTLRLCADFNQTQHWHFYRACRLTLLRTMMAAVDTASAMTDGARVDSGLLGAWIHMRATGLIDDLLSTVFSSLRVSIPGKPEPKSVGDIQGLRGFQLLWPLHTAGTCLISMGQHCPNGAEKFEWVRTLFRCIRDDLGIQAANNFLQVHKAPFLGNPS